MPQRGKKAPALVRRRLIGQRECVYTSTLAVACTTPVQLATETVAQGCKSEKNAKPVIVGSVPSLQRSWLARNVRISCSSGGRGTPVPELRFGGPRLPGPLGSRALRHHELLRRRKRRTMSRSSGTRMQRAPQQGRESGRSAARAFSSLMMIRQPRPTPVFGTVDKRAWLANGVVRVSLLRRAPSHLP